MKTNIELSAIDRFITLEKKVWDCLLSGDYKSDEKLLSDDFLGVYPSGFFGKTHHVNALKNGPIIADYEISDARIKVLSENIVLMSYSSIYKKTKSSISITMFITSIWQNFSGVWKNTFSQDTENK